MIAVPPSAINLLRRIAKKGESRYSHGTRYILFLQDRGLIELIRREGRMTVYRVTPAAKQFLY